MFWLSLSAVDDLAYSKLNCFKEEHLQWVKDGRMRILSHNIRVILADMFQVHRLIGHTKHKVNVTQTEKKLKLKIFRLHHQGKPSTPRDKYSQNWKIVHFLNYHLRLSTKKDSGGHEVPTGHSSLLFKRGRRTLKGKSKLLQSSL